MPPAPLEKYEALVASGDLIGDDQQRRAVAALDRLYTDLMAPVSLIRKMLGGAFAARGVYLYGGVGRGKSMAMDLFYASLPVEFPKRRVHFHEFMLGVHDVLHAARQDGAGEGALMKYAKRVGRELRVLCFDEFHVTDIADAMILSRLFTALLDAGVSVVATSNWAPDRLYEGGLQRDRFLPFIDLVKRRMEVVALTGGVDYRLKALTDAGVYFWPLSPGTSAKADEVFAKLTDAAVPHADMLHVKGRDIPVTRVAKGVARFTFAELCEKPMGAVDYLAIADTYHTVFLEGVPKLDGSRRNEAKRLMTLIDALYDKRAKLVVSADAPANDLYHGDDHAFEFQRTVSRLIEMQGFEYLAAAATS